LQDHEVRVPIRSTARGYKGLLHARPWIATILASGAEC
jgi:hypothetical protein